MTFDEHGQAFVGKLEELDVEATAKFFEGVEPPHEYQFVMNRTESVETFEETLTFLQQKAEAR